METYSEIIYYINEEKIVLKYYKGMIPFTWIYMEPNDPDYPEYEEWLADGNEPIFIVGTPQQEI